jgi:CDP-2,3-bis-(O-geranylgeranyl)-sn-glycerol synthase
VLHDIFFSVWFLLPAALANVAPILSAKIPYLDRWQTRLDFGKQYKGADIFGSHKTWRGLLMGMIVATIVLALQKYSIAHFGWPRLHVRGVDYATLPLLLLGPLFGFGALGGDAVESFFKRRRGIESGGAWIPFDQLDYIVGAILVTLPFVLLPLQMYVYMIVIWFGAHLLASYIGYRLKLKDAPV